MVLTNFECWAHGGSSDGLFADTAIERRNLGTMDLFNPNTLQEYSDLSANNSPKCVSHLSSNGYYGFAPVRGTAESNDAATIGSDDINCNRQQQSDGVQMMDVEQHGISNVPRHVQNSPQSANVAIAADVNKFCNGVPDRRKRVFIDEDYQSQRRTAKRSRFDDHREQILTESNNGSCPSTYAPAAIFPLSMDDEEFPVAISNAANDVYVAAPRDDSPLTSSHTRLVANSPMDGSSNGKRSYNRHIYKDYIISNPFTYTSSFVFNTALSEHASICAGPFETSVLANSNNIPNTKEKDNKLKYTYGGAHLQLNSENSTINGNAFCYDVKIDQNYDDQLEKLFLLTHGGGDYHLWHHLVENTCADI